MRVAKDVRRAVDITEEEVGVVPVLDPAHVYAVLGEAMLDLRLEGVVAVDDRTVGAWSRKHAGTERHAVHRTRNGGVQARARIVLVEVRHPDDLAVLHPRGALDLREIAVNVAGGGVSRIPYVLVGEQAVNRPGRGHGFRRIPGPDAGKPSEDA